MNPISSNGILASLPQAPRESFLGCMVLGSGALASEDSNLSQAGHVCHIMCCICTGREEITRHCRNSGLRATLSCLLFIQASGASHTKDACPKTSRVFRAQVGDCISCKNRPQRNVTKHQCILKILSCLDGPLPHLNPQLDPEQKKCVNSTNFGVPMWSEALDKPHALRA